MALIQRLSQKSPAQMQQRSQRLLQDQQLAQQLAEHTSAKATAQYAIPVAFHILVSQSQYNSLGNDTGIIRRVNSQLAVLNADFSATNADINRVPVPFQPLIGNTGLQFRLSSGTSTRTIAPGIEVKITNARFDDYSSYADAKRDNQGGLDGWNPAQNLNVWVVSTTNGTLGVAVPPSIMGLPNTSGIFAPADLGLVISYAAFGKREFPGQYFFPGTNDLGRTLTHETGHYFELDHVFGEDYGCSPDDGITDTPPQAGPTFCMPNCPAFPVFDSCSASGSGIMFMNYMDYVDDAAMMFFTQQQAARVQFYTSSGQASYSLTQQPLGVATLLFPETAQVTVVPNPSSGMFRIENKNTQLISGIQVLDITGRIVYQQPALQAGENVSINLSAFSKGLYFLKAALGGETFTRKIVLQ